MKRFCTIAICTLLAIEVNAQVSFDEFKTRKEREYSLFVEQKNKEYQEFRDKVNANYAEMLGKAWKAFEGMAMIPQPVEPKPIPPVVLPIDDKQPPIIDNPLPFDKVIPVIKPQPQPTPVVPIVEPQPAPEPQPVTKSFAFKFFNTEMKARIESKHRIKLTGTDGASIADCWNKLSSSDFNCVINDCLALRERHKLCDWAYLCMLSELSKAFYSGSCNEATLLTGYLYCSSGYKMRFAVSSESKLVLLYASKHTIYNKTYFTLGSDNFYCFDIDVNQLSICEASYPEERPLSLFIADEQELSSRSSCSRTLQSSRYDDVNASVRINENLIKFYDSYPPSEINNDFLTRWAMYANTPMSKEAKSTLYPSLINAIDGKSEYEAVSRLLNFVQTAFKYEYDDKVWGHDRAFFADETLYYPYCDCEDRSILFSRLIRDLLGLKVILIYYPGHLATAVHFSESVTGDYILVDGRRFIVCDPTYINAGVGRTMPNMDNGKAKIILLE